MADVLNALSLGTNAGFIGAGAGVASTVLQNQANQEISREQMEFQAEQASIQRDFNSAQASIARNWSAKMSNSAIQRQMRDMRLAGLNPILAGNTGGAPPGQAVAANQGGSPAGAGIPAIGLLSSALPNATAIARVLADTRKTNAEATNIEAQNPGSRIKGDIMRDVEGAYKDSKGTVKDAYDKTKEKGESLLDWIENKTYGLLEGIMQSDARYQERKNSRRTPLRIEITPNRTQ